MTNMLINGYCLMFGLNSEYNTSESKSYKQKLWFEIIESFDYFYYY